ncbi:MAG: hypothetical protein H6R10_716 [Rhodocyclaceae bacterium]|nr:hypothetical protein [Rhodocyclaceae bacterium]
MKSLLDKMRADWAVVAENRLETGDWTEEDERDIGLAVKAAVDSGDSSTIAMWSHWLSDAASWVCAYNLIIRSAEAGMRAKAAEEKAKRERGN